MLNIITYVFGFIAIILALNLIFQPENTIRRTVNKTKNRKEQEPQKSKGARDLYIRLCYLTVYQKEKERARIEYGLDSKEYKKAAEEYSGAAKLVENHLAKLPPSTKAEEEYYLAACVSVIKKSIQHDDLVNS